MDSLTGLNFTTAIIGFAIAYVVVSAVAFWAYLLISKRMGTSPWDEVEVKDNKAYQFSQKFIPLINIVGWILASWFYFTSQQPSYTEALVLGVFWLILALIIDYVGFVVIKHPLSVDAKGFYVHQYPWIYLTYLAIVVAPLCYVAFAG